MSKNKTLLSIELANILYKSDPLSFSWTDAVRTSKAFETKFYQKGYRAGDKHGFNQGYWVGRSERNIELPGLEPCITQFGNQKPKISLVKHWGAGIGKKESR